MSNSIAPKKKGSSKKKGEIERLQILINEFGGDFEKFAELTGVSVRTIQNTIWNNDDIGGMLLRSLHQKLGVSLDWLLTDKGGMFIDGSIKNDTHQLMMEYQHTDTKKVQDFWMVAATIAEKSLLQAGCVPNKDYSRIDLYKLVQPFVLSEFNLGKIDF